MTCLVCKQGELTPGVATVTLQRGECTVVFKDVPADVCDNCGDYDVSAEIADRLLMRAELSARNGSEVAIVRYEV